MPTFDGERVSRCGTEVDNLMEAAGFSLIERHAMYSALLHWIEGQLPPSIRTVLRETTDASYESDDAA